MDKINGNARKTFLFSGILIFLYVGILVIFLNILNDVMLEKTSLTMKEVANVTTTVVNNVVVDEVEDAKYISKSIQKCGNDIIDYLIDTKNALDIHSIVIIDDKNETFLNPLTKGYYNKKAYEENAKNKKELTVYNATVELEGRKIPVINVAVPVYEKGIYKETNLVVFGTNRIAKTVDTEFEDENTISKIMRYNGNIIGDFNENGVEYNLIESLKKSNDPKKVEEIVNKTVASKELSEMVKFKEDGKNYFYVFKSLDKIGYIYVNKIDADYALSLYQKLFYLEMFLTATFIIIILLVFKFIYNQRIIEEAMINKLVYQDPVTSINNENKFVIEVENVLRKRPNKKYAIVYFDVDNFSFINETYSYNFGNLFLNKVAQTLVEILGEKGIYARTRNDNFVFFYEVIKGKEEVERIINLISTKINDFARTKKINFNVRITNGIYLLNATTNRTDYNIKNMIMNANTARKKIKIQHKENIAYYDADMKEQLIEEKDIAMILLQSLENEEFLVYYQPKVDSRTQTIVAAEALIRWNHPVKGLISPAKFIPIAEKTHDIIKIDRWVFQTVCRNLRQWIDEGRKVVPISANISRIEVYEADFLDFVDKVIEETRVPVELIEIELTETVTMKDPEHVIKIVQELKKRGIKVSMDDFGTGYSSLACLKTIKLDVLKIDRSFIIDIEENMESRKLVKSVIFMAQNLGMEIVCEGVESIKQVYILQELGCNVIQGYVYHKPLPRDDFNEKLKLQELRDKMIQG